jgi:hypothetical protein
MASVDDLDQVIERSHLALGEIVNGNPKPLKEMYSHRGDVSLANPFADGMRPLGPWSVPHPTTGMARS